MNTSSPSTSTAFPIPYDDAIARYGNVQGNILKGHGRDFASFLFLDFAKASPQQVQSWLATLLPGAGNSAPITITTTKQQLEDTQRYKQLGLPGRPFASLVFTAAGLEFLLGQDARLAQVRGLDDAFGRTMRDGKTREKLSDPAPADWGKGWWQSDTDNATPIHALLTLADDDGDELRRLANHVAETIVATGINITLAEWGNVLRNDHGDGIEHFGYADGVSQPIYLLDDMPNHPPIAERAKDSPQQEEVDKWNPAAPAEELLLVPDPLGNSAADFGSFFVFRKLEQDVPGFKKAEEELGDTMKLPEKDAERVGAMVIGRFEDGTPVAKFYTEGLNKPIVNNFNYDDDQKGLKCPFHAHIRKVNPRTTPHFDGSEERLHQITRRGIPYGTEKQALNEKGKAGLLFMCFQKSITNQFEFMQRDWANCVDFPSVGIGPDVIIGPAAPRPPQLYPRVWSEPGEDKHSFAAFVTMRGGEYFYAPSLPGLHTLAATTPPVV